MKYFKIKVDAIDEVFEEYYDYIIVAATSFSHAVALVEETYGDDLLNMTIEQLNEDLNGMLMISKNIYEEI